MNLFRIVKMRLQIGIFLFVLSTAGVFGKIQRILRGQGTDVRTYPFMASIRYASSNIIACGGSIISNQHILTAAHCLFYDSMNYSRFLIYTGITDSSTVDGQVHRIDQVFFHPRFTGVKSQKEMDRHDLAIVKVKELIQFNDYQKSIDLPDRDIADDDSGVILGWGAITHPQNTYPEYLQKSFMRIFPINYCYRLYDFKMHVGQICAVNQEGVGPCMGDSGGPLVIDGKVAGVLSISLPCATGIPDIYTKVYYYLNFIRQILNP